MGVLVQAQPWELGHGSGFKVTSVCTSTSQQHGFFLVLSHPLLTTTNNNIQ
jgi:hypothetical protein